MSAVDHGPKPSRMRRKRKIEVSLLAVVLAYLAATFFWRATGEPSYLIVVALAAILCALQFLLFASMDEVEQRSHLKAWFWGGSAGVCVTIAIILALVPLEVRPGAGTPEDPSRRLVFLAGLGVGLLLPTIGYLIGLGVLWLRRR